MALWLEYWTLNRQNLGLNSLPAIPKLGLVEISVTPLCLSSFISINEYLAIEVDREVELLMEQICQGVIYGYHAIEERTFQVAARDGLE